MTIKTTLDIHGKVPEGLNGGPSVRVLKNCKNKFACLVHEKAIYNFF